ncbi:MAG TPA: hypothetical protein DEA22_05660, partial [Blastocatellia bacterium]|nr:hypothetical protein [Blastocatellia bacterium]
PAIDHASLKLQSQLSKNQRANLEKRIEVIQTRIPALEAVAAELSLKMSQPEIAGDYEKLAAITQKLGETEALIKQLYEEWESAEEQLA